MANDDDFDYGQLGRDWWLQTAQTIGASERHAKFAAAKHRGETNTSAARGAGFGGGSEASVRSEGYRLARSNKVNQLLALAVAETGSGYDGTVTRQEARQILTTLARGSDPAQRIKAIETILKLDQQEQDARQRVEDEERLDPHAMDRDLICGIPLSGVGAMIVCAFRFNKDRAGKYHNEGIADFKFLEEVAPIVSQKTPENWKRWRSRYERPGCEEQLKRIDAAAAGRVLEGDELIQAVCKKYPPKKGDHVWTEEAHAAA
jgi:hypothetical protein